MQDRERFERRPTRRQQDETADPDVLAKLTGDLPAPGAAPSTTFAVCDVAAAEPWLEEVPYRSAVETLLGGPIESCPSRLHTTLVPAAYHAFVHAVHLAFHGHHRLAISPDHIWLLICQGFANHVNTNADRLRPKLVSFEGKQRIDVFREEFVKGAMENPWEEVFPEFVEKLRDYLGDTAALLTPRFSTTGTVEAAACQITLMDAVKAYFEYGFYSGCGIPAVTLEGTPADWAELRDRAQTLRPFDLSWWIDPLSAALDHFREAAAGRADRKWWNSFYKWNRESGGPYVNGHILAFFPYLKDYDTRAATVRNSYLSEKRSHSWGVTAEGFPSGVSQVPFRWTVLGPGPERRYEMEFISGFVGVRQRSTELTLRPEIGWAVRETGPR